LRKAKEREKWKSRKVHVTNPKNDPIDIHGVKRKNIFFCLLYWEVKKKI
jgi:hypothetical protein